MKYVKICPQCGSTNITIPQAGLDLRMAVKDKCQECNNIGNFPEVKKEQVDDFKKMLEKNKEGKK